MQASDPAHAGAHAPVPRAASSTHCPRSAPGGNTERQKAAHCALPLADASAEEALRPAIPANAAAVRMMARREMPDARSRTIRSNRASFNGGLLATYG